ncbi:MAG: hypothetical protein ABI651_06165 [Verrucomicrobiota bacterium]
MSHLLRNIQLVKCSTGLSFNQTVGKVHNALGYAVPAWTCPLAPPPATP